MTRFHLLHQPLFYLTIKRHYLHVCVIGSGPAGFYASQQLLKGNPDVHVDILEKLPAPFGLVRFGVAPDHPDVKNVINSFNTTAHNPRCSFLGNVRAGQDIGLTQLREAYHAVILANGAEEDKMLGIPGEDLPCVYAARAFVGWYNGLPQNRNLNPDLSGTTAVVLGQGNVAIDVARILLTPIHRLQNTDISQYAFDELRKSNIKKVFMVGRRGPLQAAFTTKELREMVHLEDCRPICRKEDFIHLKDAVTDLPRPRRRLTELMINTALSEQSPEVAKNWSIAQRSWELRFLLNPLQIQSDTTKPGITSIKFNINQLQGSGDSAKIIVTKEIEEIPCQLILRSIGYKSIPIEASLPFNHQLGVIENKLGRVTGCPGIYCTGWVRRGPTGVIQTTMEDGFAIGKLVVQDMKDGLLDTKMVKSGKEHLLKLLQTKGIQPVTFDDWSRIDKEEVNRGEKKGKPRDKIANVDEMLQIAHKT